MTKQTRGQYIVIEGHDATGKSTQVQLLAQRLNKQGIETLIIEEPGSDDPAHALPVANRIREVIKDGSIDKDGITNLLLFTASRHELLIQRIEPALTRGAYVLSTRNWLSSLAYQGYGEGLSLDLIEQATRTFTSETYMQPNAIVMLLMEDEEERKRRIAARSATQDTPDTFESRGDNFQARVQTGYIAIAAKYNIPVISANQSIEETSIAIQDLLAI